MRDAAGLFWYGKLRPLAMSALNIVFSLMGIHYWGIIGVVIGTALSKLFTYVWYDPFIVFKHVLKASLPKYFAKYLAHWGLLSILAFSCDCLYQFIGLDGLPGLAVGAVMITLVVNGSFFLIYCRSESFSYLLSIGKRIIRSVGEK